MVHVVLKGGEELATKFYLWLCMTLGRPVVEQHVRLVAARSFGKEEKDRWNCYGQMATSPPPPPNWLWQAH